MTTETFVPKVDTAEMATATAQFLTPVVIELSALQINGKQAHWHVHGENFQAIHLLLDDLVDAVRDATDTAAERIAALGLPIDARIGTVAAKSESPELKPGFQTTKETIEAITGGIDVALEKLHQAIKGLEGVDETSQDIAIAITKDLDKLRWFFQSNLPVNS